MATDKEPFQSLTGMAEQLAEHSMEKAQGAMKNYFAWLQSAMSAAPWGNSDLNTVAAFEFVQKLVRAGNWEDVGKIQNEFMSTQLHSLNEPTPEAQAAPVSAIRRASWSDCGSMKPSKNEASCLYPSSGRTCATY